MTAQLETIVALSSGALPAGIAVIRLSGPGALAQASRLCGTFAADRMLRLRTLRDPVSGEPLDRALVVGFKGPDTVTGEDLVEFHCHGGPAVVRAVLRVLADAPSVRLAEAGEFTRRGFENGRIDLAAVEGLADLIGAETESQRRQAVRQAGGFIAGRVESWRVRLVQALAMVESGLDFSDEEDVPDDGEAAAMSAVAALADEIGESLVEGERGERLRRGLEVAIVGPPNAGKSSLLNALARRDVAIVTATPGTTRDVLEVDLDLAGYPIRVLDTAGLRRTEDPIELEGIRRARDRAGAADVILVLVPPVAEGVSRETFADHPGVVRVGTKADLDPDYGREVPDLAISVLSPNGLDPLIRTLTVLADDQLSGGEDALVTRERHRLELMEAERELWAALGDGLPLEARAEHLRRAGVAFGRLTGRIDPEEVLGAVFSTFCIGK